MTDDSRNDSQNVVQRRVVVAGAGLFSFWLTFMSVWVGVANLIDDRTDLSPLTEWLLVKGTAAVAGLLVAALVGLGTTLMHRSIWPETPDEG